MMSSSSGAPAFAGAGTGSGPGAGSAGFALTPPSLLEQVGAIARRSVMRTFRQRALLVFPLVFPLILFAINGSSLSAARKIPGFPDVSYRTFALAVPFIQGALFVAVTAGTDLARDIQSGFFDRLALTPLRGSALLAGQLGGAAVVACVQSVVYLLVGLASGVGVASGVGGALVLLALSILIAFGFAGLGALIALRFGSGEAVQGIFPLLFVTVFLSSSSLPRNADQDRLVSRRRDVQPGLLPDRGHPQLDHHRLGRAGARARLRLRACAQHDHARARRRRDEEPAGAHVRRFYFVARGVAWRSVHNTFVNPAILLPSMIFPLFFLAAFAGGLSSISDVPNFDYKPGYTAFQFAFVLLQSSAFGGVFTGFAVARDFDSGFARRLLLCAPQAQRDHRRLCDRRARALVRDRHGRDRRRADRRHERRRQRRSNCSACSASACSSTSSPRCGAAASRCSCAPNRPAR